MSDRVAGLVALLAGAFALLHRRVLAGEAGAMTADQVRGFARSIVDSFGFDVAPDMLVRIARIESNFDPSAVRPEPQIGDASAGLMQTLVSTARWLADMGYDAFGDNPDLARLMQPQASLYFGAAYLDWLVNAYPGKSEGWIVRSYNGGPGHSKAATDEYWRRYQDAKAELG